MNRLSIQNLSVTRNAAPGFDSLRALGRLGGYFRRYVSRRLELWRREDEIDRAIEHLRRLTDAQLRDLDLRRADIEQVVRYGKEAL